LNRITNNERRGIATDRDLGFYGVSPILGLKMCDQSDQFDQAAVLRRQIVTYTASAVVLSRKPWHPLWLQWIEEPNGGSTLIVRTASVEITGRTGSRRDRVCYVFPGEAATMRRARIWLMGLPIEKRDWVRIELNEGMHFAVSPAGDLDAAWQALRVAGVRSA
jgi:hypothetical protein